LAGVCRRLRVDGTITNEAYVHRHFQGILAIGIITIAIFAAKGLATYGSSAMLSAVSNRIVADNQQRIFDKLLQEDMAYFADRHSSEFLRANDLREKGAVVDRDASRFLLLPPST
jgi:ABC-type bacteriocin/lantibiotic exporter with double-glycine peptidase domain